MSQIVQVTSPYYALASFVGWSGFVKARGEAEEMAKERGLTVADMPMLIQAMTAHPELREAIRPFSIDAITGEYHGRRRGARSYEAWHSAGSLATAEVLRNLFYAATQDSAFGPVHYSEWFDMGNGSYNGQNVARVHLADAKKGDVPAPGTPYTIFVRVDKDRPDINDTGELGYDAFMRDDRVLMITGSPESRAALAKMLFGKKEDGGEGLTSVGSYHRIYEHGFDKEAKGLLVRLWYGNEGLSASNILGTDGRFVVVAGAGGAVRDQQVSGALESRVLTE